MTGKRAFVTGVSKGLGAHLASCLAKDGWQVTGVGRRPRESAEVSAAVDYLQADLSSAEVIGGLVAKMDAVPDLVVHNAVTYPDRAAGRPELDTIETTMRVNALAPYELTLDLLAAKPDDQFCSVVVINSESVYHADADSAVYAASKAALRVLTGGLAAACRSTNAAVSTLMLGPLGDANKVEEIRRIAEKRGATPAEITRLFLRRSNPDLVIDDFIDFDACYLSLRYLAELGAVANGMLCRLDGGSAGTLV
ncbi:SDR family NAD(P)-dependent oxidoreductase [Actinokineospora xionganensis]|uniref:SDR family oxidoreductase n=1 Tax=Actinokineospora xionganensis TaxID=2684470 RepID=A0ABR7L000_9PSEU|nr:SDR family oxidoreductase [Actinokineospora xionganensis]MBC6446012.1 SDR family oxidoreductase [Actinokineospora xionganensis]